MGYFEDIKSVSEAKLPWHLLNGAKILVTGATGLIGGCVVDVLMNHPNLSCQVFACGRNEQRAKKRFANYWNNTRFNYLYYDVVEPIASDVHFDYIIHAASNASPNFFATKPVEVMKSNFLGVSNLLDYGVSHGMKRILFVSSGEVYGEGDGTVFIEDYSGYVNPLNPRSCYPSSKRASETLCASYMVEYGVDFVVARPSHTYGPYFTESDNRVYAQFIRNVLRGEDIVMKSTGSQYRSWCYVVDCVSALLYILLMGDKGQAYNIADSSSNISIKELAEMVAEIGNMKVIVDMPSEVEKQGYNIVSKSIFSTDKLESLGWSLSLGNMKDKMYKTISELL